MVPPLFSEVSKSFHGHELSTESNLHMLTVECELIISTSDGALNVSLPVLAMIQQEPPQNQ